MVLMLSTTPTLLYFLLLRAVLLLLIHFLSSKSLLLPPDFTTLLSRRRRPWRLIRVYLILSAMTWAPGVVLCVFAVVHSDQILMTISSLLGPTAFKPRRHPFPPTPTSILHTRSHHRITRIVPRPIHLLLSISVLHNVARAQT